MAGGSAWQHRAWPLGSTSADQLAIRPRSLQPLNAFWGSPAVATHGGIKATTFATMTDGALGLIVPGLIAYQLVRQPALPSPMERVELLRAGTFREEAARIAARQRYAGEAHVTSTTSRPCRRSWSGMATAATASRSSKRFARGKLHLGTHALGLGAVGSTAFDDEVVEFFYPHAQGQDYRFVTVLGKRRHSAPS
jgi:hypothetical protein